MTIEDTWGGDIVTAAILHLASSTPAKLQFSSTDFNAYNTVHTAEIGGGGDDDGKKDGKMKVPTLPGLGVEPNWKLLGEPLMKFTL